MDVLQHTIIPCSVSNVQQYDGAYVIKVTFRGVGTDTNGCTILLALAKSNDWRAQPESRR